MARSYGASLWCAVTVVLILLSNVLFLPSAYAETYIGGQFGVTLPSIGKGLSNIDLTSSGFPAGSTLSDNALKTSLMGGLKLGYFFPRARWFGIETEVFYATPHIKQQSVTFTIPSSPTVTGCTAPGTPPCPSTVLPGINFHVWTWAPLNLVFRYPTTRLQPYVAVGPGVFFARLKDPSVTSGPDTQTSTKLGLNAQLGLRYYLTRHVALFGEGKYNYARFNFAENPNLVGFNATYNMFHIAFGLSYHF